MTFAGLFVHQRQWKEICPIPRTYNVLENISLVSLFVENYVEFRLLFVLFFDETVFPFLLLNSCEVPVQSGTVTTGKGNVRWNCWESVMCIIIYTFNRYIVRANGSLPHIPVSSGLSTWTVPADGRVSRCEQFYPKNVQLHLSI